MAYRNPTLVIKQHADWGAPVEADRLLRTGFVLLGLCVHEAGVVLPKYNVSVVAELEKKSDGLKCKGWMHGPAS